MNCRDELQGAGSTSSTLFHVSSAGWSSPAGGRWNLQEVLMVPTESFLLCTSISLLCPCETWQDNFKSSFLVLWHLLFVVSLPDFFGHSTIVPKACLENSPFCGMKMKMLILGPLQTCGVLRKWERWPAGTEGTSRELQRTCRPKTFPCSPTEHRGDVLTGRGCLLPHKNKEGEALVWENEACLMV